MALRNCCSFIAKLERRESFGNKKIAGAKCTYNLICQSAHHKRNLERSIKRSENTETNRVDRVFFVVSRFWSCVNLLHKENLGPLSVKPIMAWILFMGTQNILISSRFVLWFSIVQGPSVIPKRCRSKFTIRVWSSWKAIQMQALPIKIHCTGLNQKFIMKSNANASVADQTFTTQVWSATLAFALLFMMNFWWWSIHTVNFDRQRLHLYWFSRWNFEDDQTPIANLGWQRLHCFWSR